MKKLLLWSLIFMASFCLLPVSFADLNSAQVQPIVTRVTGNCENGLIQARILTLYSVNPVLKDYNIEVIADDGVVTLTGVLPNAAQKDLAIAIAKDVEDVHDVKDNITVDARTKHGEKPMGIFQKISDATITATVKTALIANPKVSARDIKVTTINGIITLEGVVNSANEKRTAGNIAADTIGVSAVKNKLNIINNR